MNKSFRALQKEASAISQSKGWSFTEKDIPEKLCLMHSEISEALEEYRKGHKATHVYYTENGKPEGIAVELADCIIRIMHFSEVLGIDMESFIEEKLSYNRTREYRHGGKIA